MPKEQVALALRMSAGNWAHHESGRNQLKAAMLPTLADLFGMTVAELAAELLDGEPGHTMAYNGNESPNNGIANYNYTESRRELSRPGSPIRELVAAGH